MRLPDMGFLRQLNWASGPSPLYLIHLTALALFVYAFVLALQPVSNSDLWFHLKTGERIVETGSLPGPMDPFNFSMEGRELKGGHLYGLRSQWLGQVMLYLGYSIFGAGGFVALKALLLILPFVLIYAWGARREVNAAGLLGLVFILAVPLLLTAIFFSHSYERPQIFSFLISCLVVAVLLVARRTNVWIPFAVAMAVIMAVWGNLHGGHAVGAGVVLLFLSGEFVVLQLNLMEAGLSDWLSPRAKGASRFFIVCVAAIGGVLLHPGGFEQMGWTVWADSAGWHKTRHREQRRAGKRTGVQATYFLYAHTLHLADPCHGLFCHDIRDAVSFMVAGAQGGHLIGACLRRLHMVCSLFFKGSAFCAPINGAHSSVCVHGSFRLEKDNCRCHGRSHCAVICGR